jgi:HK97 family phage major capsid protein
MSQDIDVKVAAEIKKGLDTLGDSIDAKLEKAAQAAQEAGDASAAKLTGALKTEIEGEIKKFNDLHERFTERLDIIETKAGRFDKVMNRKSMADAFMQKLSDEKVNRKFRGEIEFGPDDFAGVELTKADDMTAANTYTNNVPGYEHLPEIHFDPDRRNRVRDLILQGTTTASAVEYIRETAFDDQTDVTAEGAEFKQSDFDLTATVANVRKITNYVILSEEMMDDVAGMTSYILARLPSKINKDEDTQILAGSGAGQNLSGLITNAAAYSDNLADTNVQRIDVLVDAVRQVVDDEYMPSWMVLHPTDVYAIALTKDGNGQYILPWILGVVNPQLAGVPIVMTTAQTAGTFLVGSRESAQVFFRKELTVEFSNQSEDNFVKGMVTVRAQKRLALAIYRPTALLTGTFAVALAQGSA